LAGVCLGAGSAYPQIDATAPPVTTSMQIELQIKDRGEKTSVVEKRQFTQVMENRYGLPLHHFSFNEASWDKVDGVKMLVNGSTSKDAYHGVDNSAGGDVFLCDERLHLLSFPDNLKPGDRISYEYRVVRDDIAFLPLYAVFGDGLIRECRIRIRHPASYHIRPEISFARDSLPCRVEYPGPKETLISFDPIPLPPSLPAFPHHDLRAVILLHVLRNGRYLTPTTPEEFVSWYAGRIELRQGPDTVLKSIADDSIGTYPEPRRQLVAIHDWVRTHIRYVADHRHGHSYFPHQPHEVLAARYGDCKDRAYLVCALARQRGIDVHMGLVASTFRPSGNGVHPALFDHVICYYRDSVGDLFFDPTAREHALEDLPDNIIEHSALILDPDKPRQLKVSASDTAKEMVIDVSAHIDSLAESKAVITLGRDLLAYARNARTEQTNVSLESLYDWLIRPIVNPIALSSYVVVKDSSRELTLSARADLTALVTLSPTKVYLPGAVFMSAAPDIGCRQSDSLAIYYDELINRTFHLSLRGVNPKTSDSNAIWGDPSTGQVSTTLGVDSTGALTFTQTVQRLQKVLSGPDKAGNLAFCRRYVKDRTNAVTLLRRKS